MNDLEILAHAVWTRYRNWKTWTAKLQKCDGYLLKIEFSPSKLRRHRNLVEIDFMAVTGAVEVKVFEKLNSSVSDWVVLGVVEFCEPDFLDRVRALVVEGRRRVRI